jgi:predicted O-methyltransferase YrrM
VSPPISPGSAVKGAGHRLAMAGASVRLAGRGESSARALRHALRRAAVARLDAGEREWAARIEARRAEIARPSASRDPEELGVVDLAAAVEWMSIPPSLGCLLMCLIRDLRPRACLEVGTGFGLSGAYQAAALELNGDGMLTTVDVDPRWSAVATEGIADLGLDARVRARVHGPGEGLDAALAEIESLDYAFVDADHREAPTVEYLERIASRLVPGAVVVFDDVGFAAAEMKRAWRAVAAHSRVELALRLTRLGIVVIH